MALRYAVYVGTPLSGSLFDPIPVDAAGSTDSTSVDHSVGGGGLGNAALGTAPLGN